MDNKLQINTFRCISYMYYKVYISARIPFAEYELYCYILLTCRKDLFDPVQCGRSTI